MLFDSRVGLYMRPEEKCLLFVGRREADYVEPHGKPVDPDCYRQTATHAAITEMRQRLGETLPLMRDGFAHRISLPDSNRVAPKASMPDGGTPLSIQAAMRLPIHGALENPPPLNPKAKYRPSVPGNRSRTGISSGVTSYVQAYDRWANPSRISGKVSPRRCRISVIAACVAVCR